MAEPSKLRLAGAWFYAMSRGNDGRGVVPADEDRRRFPGSVSGLGRILALPQGRHQGGSGGTSPRLEVPTGLVCFGRARFHPSRWGGRGGGSARMCPPGCQLAEVAGQTWATMDSSPGQSLLAAPWLPVPPIHNRRTASRRLPSAFPDRCAAVAMAPRNWRCRRRTCMPCSRNWSVSTRRCTGVSATKPVRCAVTSISS